MSFSGRSGVAEHACYLGSGGSGHGCREQARKGTCQHLQSSLIKIPSHPNPNVLAIPPPVRPVALSDTKAPL